MADLVLINWEDKQKILPELQKNLTVQEVEELSQRRHSERSLISRAMLKHYLRERLPNHPPFDFLKTDNGKLFLKENPIFFSLAHSGDFMAFAFHPNNPIGVDLETWDRAEQILRFAPRYFKTRENSYIDQDAESQWERALQIWTSKEAWLKAEGSTVFAALEHQEIPLTLSGSITSDKVKFEHQISRNHYYLTVATTNG